MFSAEVERGRYRHEVDRVVGLVASRRDLFRTRNLLQHHSGLIGLDYPSVARLFPACLFLSAGVVQTREFLVPADKI
jgi:hypothetical protein